MVGLDPISPSRRAVRGHGRPHRHTARLPACTRRPGMGDNPQGMSPNIHPGGRALESPGVLFPREGKARKGKETMDIENEMDPGAGSGDCPTCGRPGCNNDCACRECGAGPGAHADSCRMAGQGPEDDCEPHQGDDCTDPEDCPTCGYPGCNNRCVCDICGVGPNAHADDCGEDWPDPEDPEEPRDCPTCGYPGCDNACVCDICGVGPDGHADDCARACPGPGDPEGRTGEETGG
jgi:hypothetical protein